MQKKINKKFLDKDKIFEILAIVLIILFAISISPKQLQNDTFYTVSIGKVISENGIDMKDHFSWHDGLPYTYPHWLYDLSMFEIFNLGGWDAIYISTCVLTSILGICIYLSNSRLSQNKLISFIITIAVMYLLKSYITARAQLSTFVLFILLIYNIERFLEIDKNAMNSGKTVEGYDQKIHNNISKVENIIDGKANQKRIKTKSKVLNVIAIFIIHILIANLHVAVWPFSFVLYLPYIGEYLIAEIIDIILYNKISIFIIKHKIKKINSNKVENSEIVKHKIKKINSNKVENSEIVKYKIQNLNKKLLSKEQTAERIKAKRIENVKNNKIVINKNKKAKWLIVILIFALLTGFCTPLGTTPYTYTYLTLKGNTMKNINEHLPLTLASNIPITCAIIVILAFLTFTNIGINLSDLFMLGGLCFLMFSSKRQQSMFVLIGSIAFTRMINNYIKLNTKYSIKEIINKCFNIFTGFILVALTLALSLHLYNKVRNDEYINEKTYPVKASEWILENLDVKKIKLYNEYNYGSYLLFKGIPVFIDSRCDLYAPEYNTPTRDKNDGNDIFSDFVNSSNIGTYYGDIFKKYNITHVILYKSSKMNMLIQKADWEKYREIYSDDNFVIYEIIKY